MALGVINLRPNQTGQLFVRSSLDYHILLESGSKLTVNSATPQGNVTVNGNIWGPGSLTFACNVTVNKSIGVAPAPAEIQGKQVWQYQNAVFQETL